MGLVYRLEGQTCFVVWGRNDCAADYHQADLVVVGRVPDIRIGDIVERGVLVCVSACVSKRDSVCLYV